MHATAVVLVVCSLGYWVHLQGTPEYVAMRGARALFENPDSAHGLPWQPDEMKELGLSDDKAVEVLKMIRSNFTSGATIVSGEFLKVTGKDAYVVKVKAANGAVVDVPVVVIEQNGKGVIMLGDLVLSARYFYFESQRQKSGASEVVLNDFSQKLTALGVKGYYDGPFGRLEAWKSYDQTGAEVVVSN